MSWKFRSLGQLGNIDCTPTVLGPKLIFVTGLMNFGAAVVRLVCPDVLE